MAEERSAEPIDWTPKYVRLSDETVRKLIQDGLSESLTGSHTVSELVRTKDGWLAILQRKLW